MTKAEKGFQATAEDVVGVYRFFLRRTPESEHTVQANVGRPLDDLIRVCLNSEEFEHQTLTPILAGAATSAGVKRPAVEVAEWASARLPLDEVTKSRILSAVSWVRAYKALFDDQIFLNFIGQGVAFSSEKGRQALDDASKLQGEIYGSDGRVVSGWANWLDREEPVSLELWRDETVIGRGLATVFDRGLEQRFPGAGGCAFRIALPATAVELAFKVEVREATTGRLIGDVDVRQAVLDRGEFGDFSRRLKNLADEIMTLRQGLPSTLRQAATPLEEYSDHHRLWLACAPEPPPYSGQSIAVVIDGLRASVLQVEAAVRSIVLQSHPRFSLYLVVADEDGVVWDDAARRIALAEGVPTVVHTSATLHHLVGLEADYVHLMDARSVADNDLLSAAAEFLDENPDFAAVYFDEDVLETAGGSSWRVSPRFKPDFDADLLLQEPYVGLSLTLRRNAWPTVVASLDFGVSIPSAAALSLDAQGRLIGHKAMVLQSQQAEIVVSPVKDWGGATSKYLEACGLDACLTMEPDILSAPSSHRHRIRWALSSDVCVSVIVPTRDRLDLLRPCLDSLFRFERDNQARMELIIVDHQSAEPETKAFFVDLAANRRDVRILPFSGAFNWALMNNLAAAEAVGDVLVFLNNDTVAVSPGWMDELASQALRPQVGLVGVRLIYPDGTLQHGGFVAADKPDLFLRHEGVGVPGCDGGYLGRHAVVRQTTAVTGACMAIAASKFARLGGFEGAAFPVDGNDVDLCFRARAEGWRVLYTPFATFYHLESKTRGYGLTEEQRQAARAAVERLWARWGGRFCQDPFYNSNFDRFAEPFTRLSPPVSR